MTLLPGGSPLESADAMKWAGIPSWEGIPVPPQEEEDIELTELRGRSWRSSAMTSMPNGKDSTPESTLRLLANAIGSGDRSTLEVVEEVRPNPLKNKREHIITSKTTKTSSSKVSTKPSTECPTSCKSVGWQLTPATALTALTLLAAIFLAMIGMTNAQTEGKYSLEKRQYDPMSMPNITFTLYDCTQSPDNVYAGIDLGQIDECKDLRHDYEGPSNDTEITLVQANVPSLTKVARCK